MATEITAKGDLIVGTGNATFDNLPAGTNGYTLVADSVETTGLKWVAPAGGGKVLQVVAATYSTVTTVASLTYTDTGLTATITPSSASSKVLVLASQSAYSSREATESGGMIKLVRGATDIWNQDNTNSSYSALATNAGVVSLALFLPVSYLDSPNTTSATAYKIQGRSMFTSNSGQAKFQIDSNVSSIILLEIGA
jgi:hypothetical protein